jgi:hypothetical protein
MFEKTESSSCTAHPRLQLPPIRLKTLFLIFFLHPEKTRFAGAQSDKARAHARVNGFPANRLSQFSSSILFKFRRPARDTRKIHAGTGGEVSRVFTLPGRGALGIRL